ncbi:MAG TPA: response regulator transcription factor [Gemmatimonadaceae bacterium]|nr:response regulator transcription factor [Gemmatimonadaceae bacterium]
MTTPLRVLLLEDSETDAELIRHELRRSGLNASTERVDSETDFTDALRTFSPQVVLSDHSLTQFDAGVALQILRMTRSATPLILVTGALHSEKTVACLRAGAEDLVLKANLSRLVPAITNAIAIRKPLHRLTPRQIEVLRLMAEGSRTRDIASRLNLSVKTVESHRGEVMKRLCIHELVGLVRYAIRVGLVPATPEWRSGISPMAREPRSN